MLQSIMEGIARKKDICSEISGLYAKPAESAQRLPHDITIDPRDTLGMAFHLNSRYWAQQKDRYEGLAESSVRLFFHRESALERELEYLNEHGPRSYNLNS